MYLLKFLLEAISDADRHTIDWRIFGPDAPRNLWTVGELLELACREPQDPQRPLVYPAS